MDNLLWRRLRWTVTLLLLSSLGIGVGILTYQRATQPRILEIVFPTPTAVRAVKPLSQPVATTTPALVNVNTATSEQLQALKGIGPALAGRIIAWREQKGPFHRIEDLLQVSGIGPKTLEDLRASITVD